MQRGSMNSDSTYNPFEAPKSNHDATPHIKDLEFIVQDTQILCGKRIRLPNVCIATGDTEDLVTRSRVLRRLSGKYSALLIVVAIATFSAAIVASGWGMPIGVLATVVLFATIIAAAMFGQQTVEAHWVVSKRHIRRNQKFRQALAGVVALGFMALFWAVGAGELSPILMVLVVVFTTALTFAYNPETRIEIVGKKEDLFVLKGPFPGFFQQIASDSFHDPSQMADQQSESISR